MTGLTNNALAVEWSSEVDRTSSASRHLQVYGETTPPIGFVNFCRQHNGECRNGAGRETQVRMTEARWNELTRINAYVNDAVEPVTDQELYNVAEHWTYPDGSGDCEDYVLLKQYYLAELGWPRESLLITVVLDGNNAGHAVLTVRTDLGDYVLDNQSADVLSWQDTPYRFIKRQSQIHPAVWVSLDPHYGNSSAVSSARRLTTDR